MALFKKKSAKVIPDELKEKTAEQLVEIAKNKDVKEVAVKVKPTGISSF